MQLFGFETDKKLMVFSRSYIASFSCCCLLIVGCGGGPSSTGGSVSQPAAASERTNCTTSTAVSNGVTLTGTANFESRPVTTSGLGAVGAAQAIRYAEVEVLDSSGNIIQCGNTNASGALVAVDLTSALQIPKTAGDYTLRVNSRALNSKIQVSVVNNPTQNTVYSVTGNFSLAGNETIKAVTITTAPATGTLEGGAFNLLSQIYLANNFLRTNGGCTGLPAGETAACQAFTVAPKIKVFWAPGVDPGTSYLGLTYAISAYLRTADANTKGLYILGGKNGDFDCTDTDHFDNSVILHEYGHFLEEFFAKSDSPGGSHTGNNIIDPRLAWSEGWANFFQGAVLGSNFYRDTIRTPACASGSALQINVQLDDQRTDTYTCSGAGTLTHSQDVPTTTNEGVFREISVSRTLYQLMSSSTTSGISGNIGFNYIWRAFNSTANGIAGSGDRFRNSGLVNNHIYTLLTANSASTTGFGNVMTFEKQAYDTATYFYAQPVIAKACAAYPFTITGGKFVEQTKSGASTHDCSGGSFVSPSMQKNNQFYRFDWSGGTLSLNLKYKFASARPNLNLYLYPESHTLLDLSTAVAYSAKSSTQESSDGTNYVETVTAPNLAAGSYMVHVEMDTATDANYNGISAQYFLTLGSGSTLCP